MAGVVEAEFNVLGKGQPEDRLIFSFQRVSLFCGTYCRIATHKCTIHKLKTHMRPQAIPCGVNLTVFRCETDARWPRRDIEVLSCFRSL